ncbi:MAG TPA: AraC family transcriptional regulator [Puia sp.]|nr:AraC family transcriptional regulator [Puia sp.]
MKPIFHKVPAQLQSSFSIVHERKPNFGPGWHYHPELELHYVIRGEGVRFIGDNISNFFPNEILLLGSNLPHTWNCKDEYYEEDATRDVEVIYIHFLPDCLGTDFLRLPEAWLIPKLLEKAKHGMIFTGEARNKLAQMMFSAIHATGLDKLIVFMNILKLLAETEEYTITTSAYTFYPSNESDNIRINAIYDYTMRNFKRDITLKEVASISNLSVTSFCRYFKLMTNKTYYDFLIEIRISHACRMLVDNKHPIGIICADAGFNNLSNFYRHFKKVTNYTPLEYTKKYLVELI